MAWGAVDDSPQALGTITTCTLDTIAKGDGRLTAWWAKDPRSVYPPRRANGAAGTRATRLCRGYVVACIDGQSERSK